MPRGHYQLENPRYRNWVRAALGLKYLKQGLEGFVTICIKDQHAIFTSGKGTGSLGVQCTQCTHDNLLPDHPRNQCIQRFRSKCFCNTPTGRRKCPNNVCSRVYDLIVLDHDERSPFWHNTDPSKWYSEIWEIAKCFLGAHCQQDVKSAADTDITGLLTIIINNVHIRGQIDCIDNFSKVRDIRNEIMHSTCYEVEDEKLASYLDQMIEVLRDKTLAGDTDAQNAILKLEALKTDKISISIEDVNEMRDTALLAIQEEKQKVIGEIKTVGSQVIDNIESKERKSLYKLDEREKKIGEKITETTQDACKAIEQKKIEVEIIYDRKMKEKKLDIKMKDNISETEMKFSSECGKQALQKHLLDLYTQYDLKTEVSPFLPSEDQPLDDIFAQPIIIQSTKTTESAIKTFKDFLTDKSGDRFKNIFLTGKPGIGKSTICKRMLSIWCEAHTVQSGINLVKNYDTKEIDIETMKKVQFLFYVSLPHAGSDQSIEEMIRKQLLDRRHLDLLETVLEREPENCLVILDGLDEWTIPNRRPASPRITPGLPDREVKGQYTTFFATRPWKLSKIKPSSGEVDVELKLEGLDNQGAVELIKSIFAKLNKNDDDKNQTVQHFCEEVTEKNIGALLTIQLLLKMIVCLWNEGRKLEGSVCGIYASIIETILSRAVKRNRYNADFQRDFEEYQNDQKKQNLPECFSQHRNCKEMSTLLLSLSKFAFDTLFVKGEKGVFNIKSSNNALLTEKDLEFCLKTGLLSVTSLHGISAVHQCRTVSFIHETFHEFFSALYSSVFDTDEAINIAFKNCKVLGNVIELQQYFLFMCGMNPPTLNHICENIAYIAASDECVQKFRLRFCASNDFSCKCKLIETVQRNIAECINEVIRNGNGGIKIRIKDLFLDYFDYSQLDYIDLDHVTNILTGQAEIAVQDLQMFKNVTCMRFRYFSPKFIDVGIFKSFPHLNTLCLSRVKITHTRITALLAYPTIKSVYLDDVHAADDVACSCKKSVTRKHRKNKGQKATKVQTLCISNSSGVLTHIRSAPNLQALHLNEIHTCADASSITNIIKVMCFDNHSVIETGHIIRILCSAGNIQIISAEELNRRKYLRGDLSQIFNLITRIFHLHTLNLSRCDLTNTQLAKIWSIPSITSVQLDSVDCRDDKIKTRLAVEQSNVHTVVLRNTMCDLRSVRTLPRLQTFVCEHNCSAFRMFLSMIDVEIVRQYLDDIGRILSTCLSLREVNLLGIKFYDTEITLTPKLKTLKRVTLSSVLTKFGTNRLWMTAETLKIMLESIRHLSCSAQIIVDHLYLQNGSFGDIGYFLKTRENIRIQELVQETTDDDDSFDCISCALRTN